MGGSRASSEDFEDAPSSLHSRDGTAVWFKARDISGRTAQELKAANVKKYDGPSGRVPAPFNPIGLDNALKENVPLLMVERKADAASVLAAYDASYPVAGLSSGTLPQGHAERMSEHSVLSAYLLTHNDEAGARHTEHAKGELSALGVRVYIVNLPGLHDLNEEGRLEYSKARALAGVEDENVRTELLELTLNDGLSLKRLKETISSRAAQNASGSQKRAERIDITDFKRRLISSRIEKLPASKQRQPNKLLAKIDALLES